MSTVAPLPGRRMRMPGLRALASALVTVSFVAAWFELARPASLGGTTGYVMVSGQSMEPRLHDGDLVLTRRQDGYRRGDVVAFRIPEGDVGAGAMVIHRIVGGSAAAGYLLRGDNRDANDLWRPRPPDIIGRMVVDVPDAGRWLATVRSPAVLAGLAAMATVIFWPQRRGRRRPGREELP